MMAAGVRVHSVPQAMRRRNLRLSRVEVEEKVEGTVLQKEQEVPREVQRMVIAFFNFKKKMKQAKKFCEMEYNYLLED